jgi:hydrogenase maturation protein HypF
MATLAHSAISRRRIFIRGIVQGVGFRPFVYNLARSTGIVGFVLNSSSGVTIEAEGHESAIDEFTHALSSQAPALAHIESLTSEELAPQGDRSFDIRASRAVEGEFALIPQDVATCEDCLRDVADPENRRFAYPFTNCTNCGPRYTIIRDIPYDRPRTTMDRFRMCPDCETEYHDPSNRRFHAQPNACPVCGPSLAMAGSTSSLSPGEFKSSPTSVLAAVRRVLHDGAIVALKGLGGFQLACDAENETAVRRLRERKKRSDKPFALMVRDLSTVERICFVSAYDRELLLGPERPIVILGRRPGSAISPSAAPGNNTLGVMLANTPLHFLLFGDELDGAPEFNALVMTSGNISEEPIVIQNQQAWHRLRTVADYFLFHDRDIYMRVDDSVARSFECRPRVLRRSRGFVPQSIDVGSACQELLALGGQLKNTFCLTKDHYAILSQHIGDLENYETLQFLKETLENLKNLFRVEPRAVAHDLHPHYLTSRLAAELPLPRIGVQHHHAHIASCMADNGLRGQVIGVAFDGTGYGMDGQIWGGEFLVGDFAGFERRGHFHYVSLPGGDAGVRQTWRPALSWLRESFGSELPGDLPLFQQVPESHVRVVLQVLKRKVNTIATSSCGRLFDAVASLVGLRQESTFEGQAAIELEMATLRGIDETYSFEINDGDPATIDLRPTIRDIVRDTLSGQGTNIVATRFHNTIAAVIGAMCSRLQRRDPLSRVCLSGGTFQNMYLVERSVAVLRKLGFEVFLHSRVPPNDGGISLGQAVVANEILKLGV